MNNENKRNNFKDLLGYREIITNFMNGERQKLVKSNISLGYLKAIKRDIEERGADENDDSEKVANDRNQPVTVSERIENFKEDIANIKGTISRLEKLYDIEDEDKLFEILVEPAQRSPEEEEDDAEESEDNEDQVTE